MIDLDVLITTYPQAFLYHGGGEAELLDLAANLRALGVKADIYGPHSRPLAAYDTVLHFSVQGSGLGIVEEVKRAGKRLVLWPNLWWVNSPSADERSLVQRFFDLADCVVFKSRTERDAVLAHVKLGDRKVAMSTWGVDPSYGRPADPMMFKTIYRLSDYILWLGIIEERKNQLTAIEALRDQSTPVVFIGDYRDKAYYDACIKTAPKHFRFLPHMPAKSEILRSALQNCRVYLEVPHDPPGLSALEAGLAERPLVLSSGAWSSEQFGDAAVLVDCSSRASIRDGVEGALAEPAKSAGELVRHGHLYPHCLQSFVHLLERSPATA